MKPTIKDIIEKLKEELSEDFSYYSGKIFGSMCSYPDEEAIEIFSTFIEKNAGDPNIFLGTYNMEKRVINYIGELFNCKTASGNIVSGGSEANIIALWAARNYMRKLKKNTMNNAELIVPETRHTSINKAADMLNIKLKIAQVNENFEVDIKNVDELISEHTIGIVGIAGNTVYGAVDDISRLSHISIENNIWLHVDAAFGGFILPFIDGATPFDFSLDGVKSIATDPHKMVGSPIPNGCIIFRDKDLIENIVHHLPYFSGKKTENRTIIGTKPGAAIISTYFLLKWKGREWLKERVQNSLENTEYLKKELQKRGFEILGKARLNVFAAKPPENFEKTKLNLFKKGWRIGMYKDLWRFVVMPTITKENITQLLIELDKKE